MGQVSPAFHHLLLNFTKMQSSIDIVQLQSGYGHLFFLVNDLINCPFKATTPYRSFDTHLVTNTNY